MENLNRFKYKISSMNNTFISDGTFLFVEDNDAMDDLVEQVFDEVNDWIKEQTKDEDDE